MNNEETVFNDSEDATKPFPKWLEWAIQALILYSIGTYFIELEWVKSENSREGFPFWLWSERIVAVLFTFEYIARWMRAKDRLRYPFTAMAIVDALSVIPFYVGFFVDMRSLRLVRTLRILRLLKLTRYQEAIGRIGRSFKRSLPSLAAVGFIVFIFVFYSSTFIYETERIKQPENFRSFWDAVWWSVVTMTTVGYGDLYPTTPAGRFIGVITIIFGISVFSMFFSVLQEAFEGESDASNKDILERLNQTEQLVIRLAKSQGIDITAEQEQILEEADKVQENG